MKKHLFLIFFVLVSGADLVAVGMQYSWLEIIAKPLIAPALIGYYLSITSSVSRIFVLALFFCFLGDTLLLFEGIEPSMLIYGLFAFLGAQLLFIISFRKHTATQTTPDVTGVQKMRIAFPVMLAGTGLMIVLYPGLGGLKFPVLLYAVALTLMVLFAVFRLGVTNSISFWLVLCGALLFMISDSILAINKFISPIPYGSFWIMLTYCSALFLIVKGLLVSLQQISQISIKPGNGI